MCTKCYSSITPRYLGPHTIWNVYSKFETAKIFDWACNVLTSKAMCLILNCDSLQDLKAKFKKEGSRIEIKIVIYPLITFK